MTPYFVEFLLSPTNEEEIAIYTGWLEFVNRLTNIFSSFIWQLVLRGWIFDRSGSKIAYNLTLVMMLISGSLYSLSPSIEFALVCRGIMGLSTGATIIMKAHIYQISSEDNSADLYRYFIMSWAISQILGPLASGFLSNPSEKIPQVFDNEFWRNYPFLLPTIILQVTYRAIVTLAALIVLNIYVINKKPNQSKNKIPMSSILTIPYIKLSLVYFFLGFVAYGSLTVQMLICKTSIQKGGFDWDEEEMGIVYSIIGVMNLLLLQFALIKSMKIFGERKTIVGLLIFASIGTFSTPYLAHLPYILQIVLAVLANFLGIQCLWSVMVPLSILISNTLYKENQGIGQGLNMSLSYISKSIGSVVSSYLFAWGLESQQGFPLDISLVFVLISAFICCMLLFFVLSFETSMEKRLIGGENLISNPYEF